jgi:hypothetical protein
LKFRALRTLCLALVLGAGQVWSAAAWAAQAPDAAPPARVEARSADLLAVGLVQGDRMTIHLSRLLDNAPLRDAAVTVVLRGVVHPTVAEADGSFTLTARELTLPGAAAVQFQVAQAQLHENLEGVLHAASVPAAPDEKGNARQMWWWVLNFGVCIGFLVLFSRRKKKGAQS